jgi:hypothetical protein
MFSSCGLSNMLDLEPSWHGLKPDVEVQLQSVLAALQMLLLSSSPLTDHPVMHPFTFATLLHQQEVDAVLSQHIHELERNFKQSLDSRHLSSMAAAAAATAAAGGSSTAAAAGGGGGPGGARGLTIPAPGAAGSWQVGALLLWLAAAVVAAMVAGGSIIGAALGGGGGGGWPGGARGVTFPAPGVKVNACGCAVCCHAL